jgi:hypothetical protein
MVCFLLHRTRAAAYPFAMIADELGDSDLTHLQVQGIVKNHGFVLISQCKLEWYMVGHGCFYPPIAFACRNTYRETFIHTYFPSSRMVPCITILEKIRSESSLRT